MCKIRSLCEVVVTVMVVLMVSILTAATVAVGTSFVCASIIYFTIARASTPSLLSDLGFIGCGFIGAILIVIFARIVKALS